ncbi:hypothetical protein SAMN05216490_3203 [Mucilaginibacter mallensis]|uniref:Uncharacterized protein n=1 Tax=Mucilaginibacter mallensis TaxID=652787 RepID=A0A1H1ZQF8_MUCMA|nr:hypothetical protein [Mucilaginibacter mallensis]SDT35807.1 hypothetical protein SAMN05216490_3203 [Mucilaginibacter mallensis]
MIQRARFVKTAVVSLMLVFPYLASGQLPVTTKVTDETNPIYFSGPPNPTFFNIINIRRVQLAPNASTTSIVALFKK